MSNTKSHLWPRIHAERERVGAMLEALAASQWRSPSLCSAWSVEHVAAHLTAAASTGTAAWLVSMLRAGFNADRHNERMLRRRLGATPAETLASFRASVTNTIAPTSDFPAWLGEVVVHGQDIARPLGISLTPDPASVRAVADFYAAKDFAVNSRTLIRGLRLQAIDAEFEVGDGPTVRGELLPLVMAMAGRPAFVDDLDGDGVAELRRRVA